MERYDLFKKLPDGSPYWVGCAREIEEATLRITEMMRSDPNSEYLIRDSLTGENHSFRKNVSQAS